jgi:hypothetical protein
MSQCWQMAVGLKNYYLWRELHVVWMKFPIQKVEVDQGFIPKTRLAVLSL